LKKLLPILLLFSLAFQSFSELTTLISYEINKEYISNVLCVNRDRPEMHCYGKCYLHKKLDQDQQQKDRNNMVKNNVSLTLFCGTNQ